MKSLHHGFASCTHSGAFYVTCLKEPLVHFRASICSDKPCLVGGHLVLVCLMCALENQV